MADAALGAFVSVVLLAVVAPFVLYALVRSEGRDRETMARDDAERVARRDTDAASRNRPADRDDDPIRSAGRDGKWNRDDDRDGGWN
jgi:hypothetical protein